MKSATVTGINPLHRAFYGCPTNAREANEVSKIPIDLPPDTYPVNQRRAARRGGNAVLFVGVFAAVFALIWMVLEIF